MPSAGLQIFAGGMRLQQVTPGVTDVGNAHISGVLIAENGMQAGPSAGGYGNSTWIGYQVSRGLSGSATQAIFIGSNAGTTPDGITRGNMICIGNLAVAYHQQSVCIGYNSNVGVTATSYLGTPGLALGAGCSAVMTDAGINRRGPIAIGAAVLSAGDGCIAIGQATRAADSSVVIGRLIWGTGTNQLILDTTAPNTTATVQYSTNNLIKIGNATHTQVEIGPFNLSQPTAGYFVQTANVVVANTVAETTIVGAGTGSMTIPADRLRAGTHIRIRARGIIADTATPTLQLRIKIGATTYCDTGAIPLTALAGTHGWVIDADMTIRTAGAGGTAIGSAIMNINSGTFVDMDTTNTATTAIDTTAAKTVDVTLQWGTAAPANTLTATHLTMELIG